MDCEIEKNGENVGGSSQRPRRTIKRPSRYDDEDEPSEKRKAISSQSSKDNKIVLLEQSKECSSFSDKREETKEFQSTEKKIKKQEKPQPAKPKNTTVNRKRIKYQPQAMAKANRALIELGNKFSQDRKSMVSSTPKQASTLDDPVFEYEQRPMTNDSGSNKMQPDNFVTNCEKTSEGNIEKFQCQSQDEVADKFQKISTLRPSLPAQSIISPKNKVGALLRKAKSCESLNSLALNTEVDISKPAAQQLPFQLCTHKKSTDKSSLSSHEHVGESIESSNEIAEPGTSVLKETVKRDPKIWAEMKNKKGESYYILREYILKAYQSQTLQSLVKNVAIGYLTPKVVLQENYKASSMVVAEVRKAVRLVLRDVDNNTKIPVCEIVRTGVNSKVENKNKKEPVIVNYGALAKERIETFSKILEEKVVKKMMSTGFKNFRYDCNKRNRKTNANNENDKNEANK